MKTFPRANRVSAHIQEELAKLLLKEIKDPRLNMVTITDVKTTNDLRMARIYYSLTDSEKKINDAKNGFTSAMGFLKRELASRLGLKYMPELKFIYDKSMDQGARIENILKELNKS